MRELIVCVKRMSCYGQLPGACIAAAARGTEKWTESTRIVPMVDESLLTRLVVASFFFPLVLCHPINLLSSISGGGEIRYGKCYKWVSSLAKRGRDAPDECHPPLLSHNSVCSVLVRFCDLILVSRALSPPLPCPLLL